MFAAARITSTSKKAPFPSMEPDFVVALMGSQWYQRFLATGVAGGNGSIGNLDKEALENETALIPRTEEQRLIGAHFSRLDALITLHQ